MELGELKEKTSGLLIFNKNILRNFEPKESLLNANINRWMEKGEIISIKKGMFALKDRYEKEPKKDLYLEYIANQIIQPSYLSLEYVLSKYQLLSEPANAITSVTTKTTRENINSLGAFRYYSITPALFTGYKIKYFNNSPVWEAEKSKALFDYVYLRFIKEREISDESIGNLRINWENLNSGEFKNILSYASLIRSKRVKEALKKLKINIMLKQVLQKIVDDKRKQGIPNFVIRNFLKEYLQYPVLNFLYNGSDYKNFIFTGGSCLRICFNAPRLSEDLDFDLAEDDYNSLNMQKLADSLQDYFKDKFLFEVESRIQSDKRIYLKFPVLKELGLSDLSESDFLYVKIEPNRMNFENPEIELTPISNFGHNFIVKNYSLKMLMTGKLNAFFTRKWFKGKENEIDIKGRDFYDIFWYLQNNISPDFGNLKKSIGISSEKELKLELRKNIEKNVTSQKLSYDLKNFFPDQSFVNDFCSSYRKIIEKYLE